MVNFWEMELRKLDGLSGRQDFIGMAVDPDMTPDFGDLAVLADQNRCPKNAKERPAIHRFFAPGAIGLQHLMFLIRNQRNRQLVLVPERLLRLDRVGGDAEHGGSAGGEGVLETGEV